MTELAMLAGLCAVVFYWYSGLKARDCAMNAARQSCKHAGVQLLDQTVQKSRQHFARSTRGQLVLARQYSFEYCTDGEARFAGSVEIISERAGAVWLQNCDDISDSPKTPRRPESPTDAQIIEFKPRKQDPSNHA